MSYLLDYTRWKKIFEQATTAANVDSDENLVTDPAKKAEVEGFNTTLKNIAITPEAVLELIRSRYYDASGAARKNIYSEKNAAENMKIYEMVPGLTSAIITRYGLKNALDFYDKCGRIYNGSLYPDPKELPLIGESILIYDQDNGTYVLKPKSEFENWINSLNLERWKNGKSIRPIFKADRNLNVQINRNIEEKDFERAHVYYEYRSKAKPEKWQAGAKYNYILDSREYSLDEAKDKQIIDFFNEEYKLSNPTDKSRGIPIAVPKISTFKPGTDQYTNGYSAFFFSGEEKEKSTVLKAEKTTVTKEVIKGEPIKVNKQWNDLDFATGKWDKTDKIDTAIQEAIAEIKKATKGKENAEIKTLNVICSASNNYGGPVPATHTNTGKLNDDFKGVDRAKDPAPDASVPKDAKTNELRNQKLAWLRGKTFSDALMAAIKEDAELEKVKFPENPTVTWRITDTGGKVDTPGSGLEPGQFVSVQIEGDAKEPDIIQTGKIVEPAESGAYSKIPVKAKSVYLTKGPGVLYTHPNSKLSFINRMGFAKRSSEITASAAKAIGAKDAVSKITTGQVQQK